MAIKIARGTDPFKKYWWVILLIFSLIGGWVCLPLIGDSGSGAVAGERGLKSADQSLDALANPHGAPGSAIDLSMAGSGAYAKKPDPGALTSSLYQAPEEPAGAAKKDESAPTPAAANYAEALKYIARGQASDSASGAATARRSFDPPHGSFGALSGLGGGGSASGASTSFGGGSAGGAAPLSAFGTATPKTGMTTTRGLGDDAAQQARSGNASMGALQSAAGAAVAAARQSNLDVAGRMGGRSFDGGAAGGSLIGGPGGQSAEGVGLGNLGAKPMDLKANDPSKLDSQNIQPVPAATAPPDKESFGQQLMQMVIMMAVGGLVNGAVGGMLGMMGLPSAPVGMPSNQIYSNFNNNHPG